MAGTQKSGTGGPPYKTYGRSRSLRLPNFDYASPHVYHITVNVRDRLPLLADLSRAAAVRGSLVECRVRYRYAVYVYCLMPDHVHLLVMPNGDSPTALPVFVGAFKSLSTRAFWKSGGEGTLWQQHYYDHVVRGDENLLATGEYILNNPVRRGLASSYDEYPFCGILDEIPA